MIPLKVTVDDALLKCPSVEKVFVVKRTGKGKPYIYAMMDRRYCYLLYFRVILIAYIRSLNNDFLCIFTGPFQSPRDIDMREAMVMHSLFFIDIVRVIG